MQSVYCNLYDGFESLKNLLYQISEPTQPSCCWKWFGKPVHKHCSAFGQQVQHRGNWAMEQKPVFFFIQKVATSYSLHLTPGHRLQPLGNNQPFHSNARYWATGNWLLESSICIPSAYLQASEKLPLPNDCPPKKRKDAAEKPSGWIIPMHPTWQTGGQRGPF